jgi:hypothetical protein
MDRDLAVLFAELDAAGGGEPDLLAELLRTQYEINWSWTCASTDPASTPRRLRRRPVRRTIRLSQRPKGVGGLPVLSDADDERLRIDRYRIRAVLPREKRLCVDASHAEQSRADQLSVVRGHADEQPKQVVAEYGLSKNWNLKRENPR